MYCIVSKVDNNNKKNNKLLIYVIHIIAEFMDDQNCIGIERQLTNSNIKYKLNIIKQINCW